MTSELPEFSMSRVRFLLHFKKRIFIFLCLAMVSLAVFSIKYKFVYIENNFPLTSTVIKVPYEADYSTGIGVPKIIHQTYKTRNVPRQFRTWMQSWHDKHPDFQYWFWTDADARRLIQNKYPEFLDLFDSYPYNIQRADVIRYFILYEYGGIYADLDVEVARPISPILAKSCYLSQEPLEHAYFFWGMERLVCNAVMACRSRHPFFKQVLENLKFYKGISILPMVKISLPVMESSGPTMITKSLSKYESDEHLRRSNPVHLWPIEYFFPDADPATLQYVKKKCHDPWLRSTFKDELQKVCEYHQNTAYSNEPRSGYYGRHYWSHTYYGLKDDKVIDVKLLDRKVRLASEVLDV